MLNRLRLLQTFDHTQSQSYRKLENDYDQYQNWAKKIMMMVKQAKCPLRQQKILKKLKSFKEREASADGLSQLQYDFLKGLFSNKASLEQAQNSIKEAEELFI